MQPRSRIPLALLTLLLALMVSQTALALSEGERLYQVHCAACHGSQLEGGQAQSLADAIWQFGSQRSHIFRNIKYGVADFAMPAFEGALSDVEIDRILDFVLEREKTSGARRPAPPEVLHTLDYEVAVEVFAEDLDLPWSIAFLDAKRVLVTERPGRLRLIVEGALHPDPVAGIPAVVHEGQGGLLDVAIDPEHADNGWIYLAYSHSPPGASRPRAMTRVVRGRLREHAWVDEQVVYEAPVELYVGPQRVVHYGSRIVFDPQGHLYFSIGDRGFQQHAQDPSRPNGKVHRVNRDGSIPTDNPFVGRDGALPSLFTLGNRNPQGLAVHPASGRVWETEHGPMGGDELNLLGAGRNYGWPTITYGRNYNGRPVSAHRRMAGMEAPRLYWKPSIAVSGIDFVRGKLFARWQDRLLVGALKYEELRLLELEDGRVLHQEIILKNAGRVRDVACGPDGSIYAVLNGPGMILRLTPLRDLSAAASGRSHASSGTSKKLW
jgi:glucose/arabinose dehydrogenase